MFLERAQEAAGVNAENWKLFPQVPVPARNVDVWGGAGVIQMVAAVPSLFDGGWNCDGSSPGRQAGSGIVYYGAEMLTPATILMGHTSCLGGMLQDFRDKNEIGVCHRGPVDKVLYCEAIDRYITCSR